MKVTMMLADAAQALNGKLYILGGGWSITGPQMTPFAIALKVEVPWDEANRRHPMHLALLNADGQPVRVPTPTGEHPMEIKGHIEVGRPPGLTPGTPLDSTIALNLMPLPLSAGRYVWKLTIDQKSEEDWALAFTVRAAPPTGQVTFPA